MGSYEATNVVLARIKHLEPENATKIMGYLLMNLEENELVRLACSPDPVLRSLILRVRNQLGFSSNSSSTASAPSSPSPLNPIARPSSGNPFSQSSPRMVNNGFDFSRNQASPSSHGWPLTGFPNNPISPKSNPSLPYENICAGSSSVPCLSPRGDSSGANESVDEQQMNGYFSFLNEASKTEDLVDSQLEFGHGAQNWHALNNGDAPFHRRSFSASEVCMGSEEGAAGIGLRPCLYFSRGFCKNGSNCKFLHGGLVESLDASSGVIVGSPSKFDGFDQREEFLRLKAAQQQKLASMSPSSYEKYLHLLLQQQNDPQRLVKRI